MAEIFSGTYSLPCKLQREMDSWQVDVNCSNLKLFCSYATAKGQNDRHSSWLLPHSQFFVISPLQAQAQAESYFSFSPRVHYANCSPCLFALSDSHKPPSGKGTSVFTKQPESKQSGLPLVDCHQAVLLSHPFQKCSLGLWRELLACTYPHTSTCIQPLLTQQCQ